MPSGSAQKIDHQAIGRAGIEPGSGIHTRRHALATPLCEAGVDPHTMPLLLGHRFIKTTLTDVQVSCRPLMQVRDRPLSSPSATISSPAAQQAWALTLIPALRVAWSGLLFRRASETRLAFGQSRLGGRLGAIRVLPTWDQLWKPPLHLHALVP